MDDRPDHNVGVIQGRAVAITDQEELRTLLTPLPRSTRVRVLRHLATTWARWVASGSSLDDRRGRLQRTPRMIQRHVRLQADAMYRRWLSLNREKSSSSS